MMIAHDLVAVGQADALGGGCPMCCGTGESESRGGSDEL